jgi:metallo-beta-lactamase class B
MSAKILALAALALVGACTTPKSPRLADAAPAQRAWTAACSDADDWNKPGPPFRVFGNTYYVGTCGITSLLIVGDKGMTVIDSGTDKGAQIVLRNIRALGFDPADVTALLMTHEHFDHVGGMARLQAATGAPVYTTAAAARVLRSGATDPADPQAQSGHPPFPPVTGRIVVIDAASAPGPIEGKLAPISTPGHTLGALSWTWRECEDAVCRTLVYADSLNPISADGYRFSSHPDLVKAFRKGIAAVGGAPCDILIAPHPVAAGWRDRLVGVKPLVEAAGCRAYAGVASQRLDKRLAEEAGGG